MGESEAFSAICSYLHHEMEVDSFKKVDFLKGKKDKKGAKKDKKKGYVVVTFRPTFNFSDLGVNLVSVEIDLTHGFKHSLSFHLFPNDKRYRVTSCPLKEGESLSLLWDFIFSLNWITKMR